MWYFFFKTIQHAYWYYIDNFLKTKPEEDAIFTFCALGKSAFEASHNPLEITVLKKFTHILPPNCNWRSAFLRWELYNKTCPCVGAFVFDESFTHLLLVKGYQRRSWTCPGGKLEPSEDPCEGAIRELWEEVGLDVAPSQIDQRLFFETTFKDRKFRGYILEGYNRSMEYKPTVPFEIEVSGRTGNLKILPRL